MVVRPERKQKKFVGSIHTCAKREASALRLLLQLHQRASICPDLSTSWLRAMSAAGDGQQEQERGGLFVPQKDERHVFKAPPPRVSLLGELKQQACVHASIHGQTAAPACSGCIGCTCSMVDFCWVCKCIMTGRGSITERVT